MRRLLIMAAMMLPMIPALGDAAQPLSALARMPVKEVTVFKDGHAFVVHEGRMPTDAAGNVPMDYLPTPVLGTFWPYSRERGARLSAVKAGQRRVLVERTALALRELIEANPGAQAVINEVDGHSYSAEIVGIPTRSGDELESTSPPGGGDRLPEKGAVLLLKTDAGTKVTPIERIRDVTFKNGYRVKVANEEFRNLLTMKLEWEGNRPGKTADVGMAYVQKGIRWIPAYKVTIDGKGLATVKLQATLINELTDLKDVTANLVIGVPTFAFKDTVDPISMQQTLAQLSPYFQPESAAGYAMSNSIMSQVAGGRLGGYGGGGGGFGPAPAPPEIGPAVMGSDKAEDLFVFTVKHVTLRKGERMALPVAEYTLKYKDVYTLDLPFAPPQEFRQNINGDQQAQLARMLASPKAIHVIRLSNSAKQPLTTAPALIIRGDQVLAQGMMTYTSPGSESDLPLTTAVDIKVKRTEKESKRTPNAEEWQGNHFLRIDMEGVLTLTNYRAEPVNLEVHRYVLGQTDRVDHDGKAEMVNALEDAEAVSDRPTWWGWYNWPYWWFHFNGLGRFTWNTTLAPGKSVDLGYGWHYFWQ